MDYSKTYKKPSNNPGIIPEKKIENLYFKSSNHLFINEKLIKMIKILTGIIEDIIFDYSVKTTKKKGILKSKNIKSNEYLSNEVNYHKENSDELNLEKKSRSMNLNFNSHSSHSPTKNEFFNKSCLLNDNKYTILEGQIFSDKTLEYSLMTIFVFLNGKKTTLIQSIILMDKLFNSWEIIPTHSNIQK